MAYHPTAELASCCATLRGEDIAENVRERVHYPLGDPHNPSSCSQLERRFHELVTPVITDPRKMQEMIERVRRLDEIDNMLFN